MNLVLEDRPYKKEKQIEIWNEFKKLDNDEDRWKFIVNHKDADIIIWLDSDLTWGSFDWDNDSQYLFRFDDYLGYSNGLAVLLRTIGLLVGVV